MRITKLSLTNFRSFKKTQTIEFAPVTLLFGPNSVGKSTVLMALFYLQQILDKGQCNPQKLDALGGKFVGGFENLVNGKELSKPITIAVEYDKGDAIGQSYANILDLVDYGTDYPLSSPIIDARKIKIELEIAQQSDTQNRNNAYVRRYKVWFDDEELIEVNSDSSGKQPFITAINYAHPNFLDDNHTEQILEQFDNSEAMHDANYALLCQLKNLEIPSQRDITKGAEVPFQELMDSGELEFDDGHYFSQLHTLMNEGRVGLNAQKVVISGNSFVHVPIGIKGNNGALPKLGNAVKSTLDNTSEQICRVLEEVLSDMLVAPLDNLLTLLNDSLCIGPLRTIPDATYIPNHYPNQADWYNGAAAWDYFAKMENSDLEDVNDWISNETKLNMGYSIAFVKSSTSKVALRLDDFIGSAIKEKTELFNDLESNILDKLSEAFESTKYEEMKDWIETKKKTIMDETKKHRESLGVDPISRKEEHYTPSLWDLNSNITVNPSETGAGISQLMPLVIASIITKKGLISIEQPELHVHPRIQVAIGDLLTQSSSGANYLIETHSEHLILRLRKRVRQTTENELPEGFKPVRNDDISIVYFEPSPEGVIARRIKLDEDGEFTSKWPQGFFSERRGEYL